MTAYLIAHVDISDAQGYEEYKRLVPPLVAAHGGRYLVRGGSLERLEGDGTVKRLAVLEFPSMTHLKAFYESPEYRRLIAVRQSTTQSTLYAAEGVS